MSDTAFQTQYRQEFIAAFEQKQSLLRDSCTTEAVIKGNTAVFLVAGSGSSTVAVTRGVDGLIPARADDLTQNSCTLEEWHDLARKTGFNIFGSQGNQRAIMQETTVGVINRKIDSQVLTELNTTSVTIGAASATPNVSLFQNARVKLGNAAVPWDSNITFVCGASFLAFMEQAPEFSSMDFVDGKPYAGTDQNASWRDKPMAYRWRNVLILEHPNVPGVGTASEKAFLFHKSAIGHAADTGGMQSEVGRDGEQDYSWARATMYMGAKMLQTSGVVEITYDGSTYA